MIDILNFFVKNTNVRHSLSVFIDKNLYCLILAITKFYNY